MVQVDLRAEAGFHEVALPVNRHEIHVEQRGGALHVERARGYAVFAGIDGLFVHVARRRQHVEGVVAPHFRVYRLDEAGEGAVEAHVSVLHLHRHLAHGLVLEVAGVERHVQQVGHAVGAEHRAAEALLRCGGNLFVHQPRRLERGEAARAFLKAVLERLLHAAREEVAEIAHEVRRGLPRFRVEPLGERGAGIEHRHPRGQGGRIVCAAAPTARRVVYPDHGICRVSALHHGAFAAGGYGIYEGFALRGYFKFVAESGDGEVARRNLFVGHQSRIIWVVHTERRPQRGAVYPLAPDDCVVRRRGARGYGGGRRSEVGTGVRVFRIGVHAPFVEQFGKTVLAVERLEGIEVIRAQLVDENRHHHARHAPARRSGIGFHGGERSHHCEQRNDELGAVFGHIGIIVLFFSIRVDEFTSKRVDETSFSCKIYM